MKILRRIRQWFSASSDAELQEEIEFHRAALQAEYQARGMNAREANAASRRAMGNATLAREDARDAWIVRWCDQGWRDLRSALRGMGRERLFAFTAILTLALGMATTTTIFSVVDAELWKALPYPHPERLVAVYWQGPGANSPYEPISGADFEDWRAQSHSFEALAGLGNTSRRVLRRETSQSVLVTAVTSNFFAVLGRPVAAGRDLTPADEPGARAVMLSDRGWQRLFARDPSVVGRPVLLDGRPVIIAGVLEPDESLGAPPDIYALIDSTAAEYRDRTARPIRSVIGRLRADIQGSAAEAELQTIAARLARAYPDGHTGYRVQVEDLRSGYTGFYWRPLYFFLAASLAVLVLSCANVAALLLARALRRRREFAIRGALGGGPPALARQLLLEGLLIGAPAALAATLLTAWGVGYFAAQMPAEYLERGARIPVDARVGLFVIVMTVATVAVFGAIPLLFARRVDLNAALTAGGRSAGAAPAQGRLQKALLILQIAVTLVLLAGAGLFVHSYLLIVRAPLGFDPAGRAEVRVSLSGPRYAGDAEVRSYAERALAAVLAVPAVTEASLATSAPLESGPLTWYVRPDQPRPTRGNEPHTIFRAVGPGYFSTNGIRLVRGRAFTDHDVPGAPPVAIINEHLAKLAFGDEDPVGRLLEIVPNPRGPRWMARPGPVTIVGVASAVKQVGINEVPMAEVIVPFAQWPAPGFEVVARTPGPAAQIAAGLRAGVAAVDPDIPVGAAVTLDQRVEEALKSDRFNLLLISAFAAVAIVIAAVGIYGTIAYAVVQREREFGVRLALGATPRGVVLQALSLALRFGFIGGLAGLAGAFVVARSIGSALYLVPGQHEGLLYGVRTSDPIALCGALVAILAVAAAAGFFPARRVGRIDPALALRQD